MAFTTVSNGEMFIPLIATFLPQPVSHCTRELHANIMYMVLFIFIVDNH